MSFTYRESTLAGTLHLPQGSGRSPAIVMVPGSGDSNRDADDFFPPIRNAFLEQGVAVLSWDKPGVGESNGDWRRQTILQRAEETSKAITWLRQHPSIDPSQVGFWGQSQGGWIGPMVAANDPDLWLLIIHSGTGVTVEEQDFAGLEQTMRRAGASDDEIALGRVYMDTFHDAAKSGMTYEDVREKIQEPARGKPWFGYFGDFSEGDWEFFLLNFAPETIFDPVVFLNQVTCPTLAIFGEKDVLIPVQRSIEILENTVRKTSQDLVIKVFANGTHRLSPAEGPGEFVPGYFEFMREWLSTRLRDYRHNQRI
jgi:pimeloyl-ACP methyl ester carboxylesterase